MSCISNLEGDWHTSGTKGFCVGCRVSIRYPSAELLPVSGGQDVDDRRGVAGCAEWLAKTVRSSPGEHQPVPYAELRQQTVLQDLVQVITGGTPQTAAEHWSIQGGVLPAHTAQINTLKNSLIMSGCRTEVTSSYKNENFTGGTLLQSVKSSSFYSLCATFDMCHLSMRQKATSSVGQVLYTGVHSTHLQSTNGHIIQRV